MESDWAFSFWYHMHGSHMGELSLQGLCDNVYTTLWEVSGDQGSEWLLALVAVPSSASQLRFVAVTGVGYLSDIAIDEFSAQLGRDFETHPVILCRCYSFACALG